MQHCRNCGCDVATWEAVKAAIMAEYTFTEEELDDGNIVVHVYHPECAVADERIDNVTDLDGAPFYWEACYDK